MKRRVHVVFTGGTIGSAVLDGRTGLDASPPRQLLTRSLADHDVEFSESEPFRILSEDATPEHWTVLARHIAALDLATLDAVVVAHGSDTLAWTAKALAYALLGCPKPVVMVASDLPLSDDRANGYGNFIDGSSFALSENLPGVFVAWANPGEATAIHLATRILPCDIHDDKFRSVRGLGFGSMVDGRFRRNAVDGNPSRSQVAKSMPESRWIESRRRALDGCVFESRILVLPSQPTGSFDNFPTTGWKAVLQLAYHSGTASSGEGDGSFLEFARDCRSHGASVLVGPCRHADRPYPSIDRLSAAGIDIAPSLPESTLVVKLRWLLGQGLPSSAMHEPLAFDLLPETTFAR